MRKTAKEEQPLSRRERQIMDIVYQHGAVTVTEVLAALPDTPSYSTVRTLLNILEQKGYLQHTASGTRYVYQPTHPRDNAGKAALRRVLQTFFAGSLSNTVAALIDVSDTELSPEEVERLRRLIDESQQHDE